MLKPSSIEVHPTETCNYNCLFCPNVHLRNNFSHIEKLTINKKILFNIIDDCETIGVKRISFSGGGEPLLNLYVPKAINYARKKGIFTKLVTNGYYLNRIKNFENINDLRISINACDKETFKIVCGFDGFDTVIANLKQLFNHASKNNFPNTSLSYQITSKNCTNLEKIIEIGEKYKIGSILFEFPYSVQENLRCNNQEDILNKIENISQEKTNTRIIFSRESISYCKNFDKCAVPFHKITISGSGKVFPCCQTADYLGEKYRQFALGEITPQRSLFDILSDKKTLEIINSMDISTCPECIPSELRINNDFNKKLDLVA